jgi:RNA recognition motif-containing protein
MEDTRAVFVSNISPNATEKTVSDFFSFCGRITRLALQKSSGDSQEAVVVFETDSAAKTALLLTNALIVDRPITVVPHTPSPAELAATGASPQASAPPQDASRPPEPQRSHTSVIASLVAAGYVLGADAATKAREIDDKHMISLQLKVGAEQIKAKANEIDRQLHISETASVIKTVAVEKAKEVDEKLHITEKVGAAASLAKQQASALAQKANENETVAKGVSIVKAVGSNIQKSFQNLKDESLKAIEEKKAERGQTSPIPSPRAETTQTTAPDTHNPPPTAS